MAIVAAKCTQCGTNLKVDDGQEAAICPACQTPFITEKAINNYNTTYVTNIDHLHADVVKINNETSIENRNRAGETFIKLDDYQSAEKVFKDLAEKCPYDYRGWWGLIRVETQDFTNFNSFDMSRSKLEYIEQLYHKANIVISENDRPIMGNKVEEYCEKINGVFSKVENDTNLKMQQTNLEYNKKTSSIQNEIDSINNHIELLTEERDIRMNAKSPSKAIIIGISIVLGVSSIGSLTLVAGAMGGIIGVMICVVIRGFASWTIEKFKNSDDKKKYLYNDNYNRIVQDLNYRIQKLNQDKYLVQEEYDPIFSQLSYELQRVGGSK